MSINGRLGTGFSSPYVSKYRASGGIIRYDTPIILANGVSLAIKLTTYDSVEIYEDEQVVDIIPGAIKSGEVTVKGNEPLESAFSLIYGIDASSDGSFSFNDETDPPYVGLGSIIRKTINGERLFCPIILPKVKFHLPEISAETAGDSIEIEYSEMIATILRADDHKHTWIKMLRSYTKEDDAILAMKEELGG